MKKLMKITAMIMVLTLCLIMISACGNQGQQNQGGTEAVEPIRIGVLIEQSGAFEEWGRTEQGGIEIGFDWVTNGTMEIDGRPIELIIRDTASEVNTAVQRATQLIEADNVDILTGSTMSAIALAVSQLASSHNVPYVIGCAAVNSLTGSEWTPYTFQTGRVVRQVTTAIGAFTPQIGTRFAILGPDTAAGHEFAGAFATDIEANGGEIVYWEHAPQEVSDFTPFLFAIRDSGADALVVIPVGHSYTVTLPQQLHEMGLLETLGFLTDFAGIPFYQGVGDAGIGMVGTVLYWPTLFDSPMNDFLVQEYERRYNDTPDLWAGNGFTAAIAIVEALRLAQSTDSEDIVNALRGLSFTGIRGEGYYIRPEDHRTLQPMTVTELRDMGRGFPEPVLLEMISPEDSAPPIENNR